MNEFRILAVFCCLLVFSACQPKLLYTLVPENTSSFSINDIRYDSLKEYNQLAYYLPNEVWSLTLNNFPLEPFPEEFKAFKNIKYLTLEGYQTWYDFPEEIYAWQSIEGIHAEYLNISQLPEGLSRFSNLKELHLGNNAFTDFPESICGHGIEYLWMNDNPLNDLPDVPACLDDAKILDFQGTPIPPQAEEWQKKLPACTFIWK